MNSSTPDALGTPEISHVRLGRRGFVLIAAASVLLLLVMARALGGYLTDDTYIFLRYARNIAEGNGAVFNLGERVEGFTSPLWTFLLAGLAPLCSDLETLVEVLSLACGGGVVVLLLTALRRQTGSLSRGDAVVLGLGLAGGPALALWSASGMDVMLFTLLTGACLVSAMSDRHRTALSVRTAMLLLLATLTRPEGVLVALYVAGYFVYEKRSVRVMVGYVGAVGCMFLIRYAYFGAWLPNTYHAKMTFGVATRLSNGVAYILPALGANWPLVVSLLVLLAVGWKKRLLTGLPVLFLGGWVMLWIAYVLHVGGDHLTLFRFLMPVLPALFLLFGLAWVTVRAGISRPNARLALAMVAVAFTASNVMTYRVGAPGHLGGMPLTKAWGKVGRWIGDHTPPDTVVATIVPGAVGYFSDRRTVDMLGLTDRTVACEGEVYPKAAPGHARYHTDYILETAPDIVLYHSSGRYKEPVYEKPESIQRRWGNALYDLVNDPRFAAQYEYKTVRLDDGTVIEMQVRRSTNKLAVALTKP